jgi:Arc/MetJ family transcription regulator
MSESSTLYVGLPMPPDPGTTSPASGLGFRAGMVITCVPDVVEVHSMRTNIEIDDKLMKDALRATGAKTKKEAVELGLRTLLDLRAQEKARELRGKITWEGDLNVLRTDK